MLSFRKAEPFSACEMKGHRNKNEVNKTNRSISEDESTTPVGHYRKMADYWWNLL